MLRSAACRALQRPPSFRPLRQQRDDAKPPALQLWQPRQIPAEHGNLSIFWSSHCWFVYFYCILYFYKILYKYALQYPHLHLLETVGKSGHEKPKVVLKQRTWHSRKQRLSWTGTSLYDDAMKEFLDALACIWHTLTTTEHEHTRPVYMDHVVC